MGIIIAAFMLFCIACALSWLLPSIVSKVISPPKTSYGTVDRHKQKKHEPFKLAFCFVSFVGWCVIYRSAFYDVLFFLPDDWGGKDGYGEWTSYRSSIAGTIGFWLSIWTLVQLEKIIVRQF